MEKSTMRTQPDVIHPHLPSLLLAIARILHDELSTFWRVAKAKCLPDIFDDIVLLMGPPYAFIPGKNWLGSGLGSISNVLAINENCELMQKLSVLSIHVHSNKQLRNYILCEHFNAIVRIFRCFTYLYIKVIILLHCTDCRCNVLLLTGHGAVFIKVIITVMPVYQRDNINTLYWL